MKYPLRNDYDPYVRNLNKFVFDNVLKQGRSVRQKQNPNFLLSYNGGKAIVYVIQTNSKKYALKCWVEDLGDLKYRYKEIDRYLKGIKNSYFVDFSYNEQGILVNGIKFPIVRMEWIDGISFKEFISNNINNPACIRSFAEKFLEMVKVLHQNNISHGDLQHGNIMVRKNGDICLIDYDSLYVPQLSNKNDNIKGLDGYQHPNRNKLKKLSPKSDYFSELIIYLSLLVISEKPSYWKNIEQEERLLFSEKDLANPRSSQIFAELRKLSPEIRYFTQQLENFCREPDIEKLKPLENLVTVYTGSKTSFDSVTVATPNLSSPKPTPVNLNSSTWDTFSTPKPPYSQPKPSRTSQSNSDPWAKLDNSLSSWDKFDKPQSPTKPQVSTNKASTKDPWNKLGQSTPSKPPEPVTNRNVSSNTDSIWDKFRKSVSSIWDRFISWFN